MLVGLRYSKICKYDGKYKNIVYGKCFFNQISSKKFESFLFSKPMIYKPIEYKSKRYPYSRPCECFFNRYFLTLSMKDSEIECKHKEDKYIEPYPKPDIDLHKRK